jgi:hypothetical protein
MIGSYLDTPDFITCMFRLSKSWRALADTIPVHMWEAAARGTERMLNVSRLRLAGFEAYTASMYILARHPGIRVCKSLRVRFPGGVRLPADVLRPFLQWNMLEHINVSLSNDIRARHVGELSCHRTLKTMVISECEQFGDSGLKRLPPSLTALDISSCREITDKGMQHLEHVQLRTLSMRFSKISNPALSHLALLPLTELDLSWCREIGDSGLTHLKTLPLRKLCLQSCQVSNVGLAHLKNIPLQELDVADCEQITDDGLVYLTTIPLLKLRLQNCGISNDGLAHLSNLSLRMLDLGNCAIDNDGLQHLTRLPLEILHLSYCKKITNDGLIHLLPLPLSELHLYGRINIDTSGLRCIREKTPPVHILRDSFQWLAHVNERKE